MGKPLRIDWETVRLVAVQIGVREAARQFELSEDAVCMRSMREGWLKQPEQPKEVAEVVQRVHEERGTLAAVSRKPVDVLSRLAERTKLRFAKGLDKGANAVRKLNGDQILDKSGKVKDLVDAACKLHGWSEGNTTTNVAVNLAFLRE